MGSEHSSEGEGERTPNPADTGEATKPAKRILSQEIAVGQEQLERSGWGLFLSAISAGLDIGFGPFMVVTVLAIAPEPTMSSKLLGAFVYAIGFVIVILGRSELFTEHTTLAVLPLLSGKTSMGRLARLWTVVFAGNVVGTFVFASFASPLGKALGLFDATHVRLQVAHLMGVSMVAMFGSAVAAGWLMGLVSWLVTAARDTVGQIVVILLVTGSIAFLGLHHSIAGTVEVLMGVLGADTAFSEWLRFLAATTLGNAVGGIVFVAGIKYGHIRHAEARRPRHGRRAGQ